MEYLLVHKDQPSEYLLIGTDSLGSFWPDQGLQALMNIVDKTPEKLVDVEIKTSGNEVISIAVFLDRIKGPMDKLKKAKVLGTHVTSEGTLYKDSIVRVENIHKTTARVRDEIGKIYYLDIKDIMYIKY